MASERTLPMLLPPNPLVSSRESRNRNHETAIWTYLSIVRSDFNGDPFLCSPLTACKFYHKQRTMVGMVGISAALIWGCFFQVARNLGGLGPLAF